MKSCSVIVNGKVSVVNFICDRSSMDSEASRCYMGDS